ncbi:MAG: DUF3592 domain-containing protein [Geminicoccaceae bacterium]|nr:DUF3592 domain-containing protein [Geminicoccaceae bacterium]MCB9942034.1 DUF3592 domain-containing protein [Geminicoccaceae bacterium]
MSVSSASRSSLSTGHILIGLLLLVVRSLIARPRTSLVSAGLIGFGLTGLWQELDRTMHWKQTHGMVLAAIDNRTNNPFRNMIVRYTDAQGDSHDILDGAAAAYLDQGPEAARNVPVMYDPAMPRIARVATSFQWWESARYILLGLLLLAFVVIIPQFARRMR